MQSLENLQINIHFHAVHYNFVMADLLTAF